MGRKSAVAKASSNSISLRATIPEEIVQEMKLKAGDVLDWEVTSEDGRKVMKVKRLE
ncbi:MAG: AbrB/MazE/SpoVT family DNA-binding domain-containing protein [Nitrososphaerales archaeon]|jgi:bifunctional DNA-binding transcriptional regulator/antitoxin component of YhaV-PrlF toxin-antitoxin module